MSISIKLTTDQKHNCLAKIFLGDFDIESEACQRIKVEEVERSQMRLVHLTSTAKGL